MGNKLNTRQLLNNNYKKNVKKGTCKKIENNITKQTPQEKQITEKWKEKYFYKEKNYD